MNATTRLPRFRHVTRSLSVLLMSLVASIPLAALASPDSMGSDVESTDAVRASTSTTSNTAAPAPDGSSEQTAAASCWEIVQNDPSAQSGVYWLVTPALGAPQQFYCDQETDGGGWVLVGRGREHWTQSNEGRLTSSDVAQTPSGTSAFSPAQLPADTIDGLLNDGRVDALAEGVRLRRAESTDGSSWQEVRFRYGTAREGWSWQFSGLQSVNSWSIGSSSGSSGTTGSFGNNNTYGRVDTAVNGTRGWARGFSYGASARGSSSASSYVWASSSTNGYPRPFTQVYLRPRLIAEDIFTAVPDEGLPESTRVATAESYPLPTPWGVSGLGASGSGELNTEVSAFAESEGVMYVGGNFRYVQRDASGSDRVEQSYLAAFDVATGEWISTFRPQLDNQVKALAVLPDGRLAVGGSFGSVAGEPSPAFAVLDPTTGTPDTAVATEIINYTGGVPPVIRTMDVGNGYLYIGGRFTHLTGSGVTSEVYQRNIGRLDATTLAPAPGWDPMLDGTVVSLDASEQGDRVYAAGYFGLSRWTEETPRAGAFTTSDATVIPWSVDFSNTDGGRLGYQQAVKEIGNKVWLGGSEHMLFSYDRSTMAEASTNITQNGGDFQAIAPYGSDRVAAGCHCSENVYQGARKWPSISGFSRVEHIDQVGIWQSSDGAYAPEYSPQVSLRSGYGAWAIQEASDGALWVGGDYTHARKPNTQNQWTGAFVRFAAADAEAPAAPGGLSATSSGDVDQLSWDAVSGASYEVLREDRVVASTTGTSMQLPALDGDTRYFVRAVDQASNRSATTPVAVAEEVDPNTVPTTVVSTGGEWTYHFDATAPDAAWNDVDFDDSTWNTGTAPLGWGHSDLGTQLPTTGTRPLTAYYRRAFTIEDATKVAALEITTRADDGIVLYVNGTEVGRTNMPEGTIGHGTYATAAPSATTALANPVTLTVPGSLLTTGNNIITAEVHSNYRNTPSTSFDLEATTTPGQQPTRVGIASESSALLEQPETYGEKPSAEPGTKGGDSKDPSPARDSEESAPEEEKSERSASPDDDEPETPQEDAEGPTDGSAPTKAAPSAPQEDDTSADDTVCTVEAVSESGADREQATENDAPEEPRSEDVDDVIAFGSDWAIACGAVAPDWAEPDFDDSAWDRAETAVGWGPSDTPLATVLRPEGDALGTVYLRHTFEVDDPAEVHALELTLPAQDGLVLHVNGVEVDLEDTTELAEATDGAELADGTASSADDAEGTRTIRLPANLLVEGGNTIAVETDLSAASEVTKSFDAQGTLVREAR